MSTVHPPRASIEEFVGAWEASGASERANYALFLVGLCDHLGVPRPDPAGPDDAQNAYVFERGVSFQNGDGTTSTGWIDLYKRELGGAGIDYHLLTTARPLELALMEYLSTREHAF